VRNSRPTVQAKENIIPVSETSVKKFETQNLNESTTLI